MIFFLAYYHTFRDWTSTFHYRVFRLHLRFLAHNITHQDSLMNQFNFFLHRFFFFFGLCLILDVGNWYLMQHRLNFFIFSLIHNNKSINCCLLKWLERRRKRSQTSMNNFIYTFSENAHKYKGSILYRSVIFTHYFENIQQISEQPKKIWIVWIP